MLQSIYKDLIGRDGKLVERAIQNVMKDLELKFENLSDEVMIDIDFEDVPQLRLILRTEYQRL